MNVGVEDTVTIINTNNAAGGIIGAVVANTTVENCYSQATIAGGTVGGIVADAWTGTATISKCYSVGYSPVSKLKAAFVLSDLYTTVADPGVSGVTHVDDEAIKGANALVNMPALDKEVWVTTDNYPRLAKDGEVVYEIGEVWNGATAAFYSGGTGTESDPYIINNAKQLRKAVVDRGTTDGTTPAYFRLAGDIYINTHGLTAEQAEYNQYAPILMTSVDTNPELCAEERKAILQRLGVGKWQIFGAHGFKKDYSVNL